MVENKTFPDLQAYLCLSLAIFMQDGISTHFSYRVKHATKDHFTKEYIISRQLRHQWRPKYPDTNPCKFGLGI